MEWLLLAVLLPAIAVAFLCAFAFFRLLAWIIALPFTLLGLLVGGVVMLVMLPVLLVAGLAVVGTLAAVTLGLLLPLLVLGAVFGGAFWVVGRLMRAH